MWAYIAGLLPDLFKTIWGTFFDSPEVKALKEKHKLDLEKARIENKIKLESNMTDAKIKMAMSDAEAQNNIDLITVKNQATTFKDDALVYTWLIIVICCFLPWTQPYVRDGFEFLNTSTPDWFRYILYAITISELGLRRMFMTILDKVPNRVKK